MGLKRTTWLALAAGLGVWLACEAALLAGGFEFLENRSFDLRVELAPPRRPPPAEIVILDIDNPSFAALSQAIGRWPWTRLLWSELVKYLHAAGARAVVFDVVFAGREPEVDAEFAQALSETGNVTLAFAFVQYEAEFRTDVASPVAATVPGAVPLEDGIGLPMLSAERHKPDLPVDTLAAAAQGLGCITVHPDRDGVVRRVPLFFRRAEGYYPSLGVAAAERVLPSASKMPRLAPGELHWGAARVPVTRDGLLVPHWRREVTAYPRLPMWKVACSIFPEVCAEGAPSYKPEDFRDKIVFIGSSALGTFDVFATPVDPATPGVLVHVATLESLLQGRAIAQPPPYVVHLLMALLAVVAAGAVWAFGSVRRSTLVVLAAVLLYAVVAVEAFGRWELWLPVAAPLGTLLASFVGQSLTRYVTTGRELRQTRQTLLRYMPPAVVEHIMAHGGPDQLRGERGVITVMFSDIRNFTKMSEKRTPVEVLEILNQYLDAMTEIVFLNHGVVDKFIGDGMLCYWGAFGQGDSHARLAAAAAAQMLAKLEELNENWRREGLPELGIGIGINTGEAVFGNLGSGKKMEFTVLGDTVNVASRLEAMNKEFGTKVVLSESTQAQLGDSISLRFLAEVAIRGREQKMKVYTLE